MRRSSFDTQGRCGASSGGKRERGLRPIIDFLSVCRARGGPSIKAKHLVAALAVDNRARKSRAA